MEDLLHAAAAEEEGDLEAVKKAAQGGADTDSRNNDGRTALIMAAGRGALDVARCLVKQGVDINASNKDGETALIKAAMSGSLDVVRYLVEQGAEIQAKDRNGYTALIWAAEYGNLDVVRYLVEQGANKLPMNDSWGSEIDFFIVYSGRGAYYEPSNNSGSTALMLAAWEGHIEVVRYLVEQGANVHARNTSFVNSGDTALILAAGKGRLDVVRYLAEHGASTEATGTRYRTALINAADKGELDVVKYLVEKGADKEARDKDNETALIKAARNSKWDVVRNLVEQSADVLAQSEYGATALVEAADKGQLDVVRFLVEQGADKEIPLRWAAWKGHLAVVRYLVEQGADNETALTDAAQYAKWDVVRYLVEHGADINAKGDSQGKTALLWGVVYGHANMVQYLVEHGADTEAKDMCGDTALICAANYGHANVAQYLVKHGADIHAQTQNGETALTCAAKNGYVNVVQYLVEQGVDTEAKDMCGDTALICAANYGHANVAQYLVKHGADIHFTTQNGETALTCAAKYGHVNVVQYLIEQGVDTEAKDMFGNTALIDAAANGHVSVVQYLVEQGTDTEAKGMCGNTALIYAAANGHVSVVRYLVELGADIHFTTQNGETALTCATANGHVSVVQYLVEHGADTEAKDMFGNTALINAAAIGHASVAQYLVEHGTNIHFTTQNGETALIFAAKYGHLNVVQYLVEQGADTEAKDMFGHTALMWASVNAHTNVKKYLEEQGANIHVMFSNDCTQLMEAAANGRLDLVRFLVEHGANLRVVIKGGWSALTCASANGQLDVVQYLMEKGARQYSDNPLHEAAANGHIDVVRYLLEQGESIDSKDIDYTTPLMVAAQNGQLNVVRYLVEQGADKDDEDYKGWTALIWAASKQQRDVTQYLMGKYVSKNPDINGDTGLISAATNDLVDVVRYLVEQGADINVQDNDSYTALITAASGGVLDVVRCLVEQGAGINIKANKGYTALIRAARKGHAGVGRYLVEDKGTEVNSVVRFLAEQGADVHVKTETGETALTKAAYYGNLDVVRYLVEQGADIQGADKEGETALIMAAHKGHAGVVQYLVEQGAEVNIRNTKGETAIYQAYKHGHLAIKDFLLKHIRHVPQNEGMANADTSVVSLKSYLESETWAISPFDIEPVEYVDTKIIGGEYRAKWLDADVVLKLFVPGASASTFKDEVTAWLQLRHPNVIKLYGACDIGHSFFVLEYASNGSVVEYLTECKEKGERETPWKLLHEAALGLAYLHERGIVHGNLRSSNVLVGSDGVAKLADFGLSVLSHVVGDTELSFGVGFSSIRWQAPERLKGYKSSVEADIYSFGLCVVAALTGQDVWEEYVDPTEWSESSWAGTDTFIPTNLDDDALLLTSQMCYRNPKQRKTAAAVVRLLEKLVAKEASDLQPQSNDNGFKSTVDEYRNGELTQLLASIRKQISSQHIEDPLYEFMLQEIESIHNQLAQENRPVILLETYHSMLVDLDDILQSGSLRDRVVALSSTRAAGSNLTVFRRRINELWMTLDDSRVGDEERERQWDLQSKKQLELFVSDVSQTVTVLSELVDDEERTSLMTLLKLEIDAHTSNYTPSQLEVMNKAYDDCCQGEWKGVVTTIPAWYLPWHELVINKMKKLGEGGFGDVYLAKWLDSEVVVKEVKKLGARDCHSFATTLSESMSQSEPTIESRKERRKLDIALPTFELRKELRKLFEHEVNVWFGLSHPHVIRLFGACHVGTPFFACEYASGGSLDKYLRKHPDEIWTKLLEAALGVQYLHYRGIIHGDLKCNNIMVGNDEKGKVADFGLSSFEDANEGKLSGAWQWVAPECIEHGGSKRSFASDVYSLGMCIVESLRVVEKIEDDHCPPYPWWDFENDVVKTYVVKRCELPSRPRLCTDAQWQLVERMCAHDPDKRIKISTVVDELAILARGDVAWDGEEAEPEHELNFVPEVITEMKEMCIQFYESATSRNGKILCQIYALLWERLAGLSSTTDDLGNIIDRARKSTLALEKEKGTLIAFTETALRGYALHRNLDKLIEAKMWSVDTFEWRDKCWKLLTSEAMS